ncbi:hypothetical protein EDD11_004306 [Mortierella claussenii]|nr:hypothetical protein EDD11_004306 [Mortierella claussenii]
MASRCSTGSLRGLTTARLVDEPSANYRPGKEGFAPGMPHPPGSSASPLPEPAPRTVESLPEMSKRHEIKASRGDPVQKYKLEMTKLRHAYQRQHLEGQSAKRAETERQRGGALRRLQHRQAEDRAENERRLSFERLMQPMEGPMTRAVSGEERKAKVIEFVKERKVRRQANYQQVQDLASEKRMDALIRLYHQADSFVTMENLDDKVNEFYETGLMMQSKVYTPTVPDMVLDVMENGGQVSLPNLLKREQDLRDVLDGTVAGGKVGVESVKAKVATDSA